MRMRWHTRILPTKLSRLERPEVHSPVCHQSLPVCRIGWVGGCISRPVPGVQPVADAILHSA